MKIPSTIWMAPCGRRRASGLRPALPLESSNSKAVEFQNTPQSGYRIVGNTIKGRVRMWHVATPKKFVINVSDSFVLHLACQGNIKKGGIIDCDLLWTLHDDGRMTLQPAVVPMGPRKDFRKSPPSHLVEGTLYQIKFGVARYLGRDPRVPKRPYTWAFEGEDRVIVIHTSKSIATVVVEEGHPPLTNDNGNPILILSDENWFS